MSSKRKYGQMVTAYDNTGKKKRSPYRRTMLQAIKLVTQRSEERKYMDTQLNAVDMVVGGTVTQLAQVAEGTSFNQRVGRNTHLMYLQYDFVVYQSAAVIPAQPTIAWNVHFMLDRQANAAAVPYGTPFDTSAIQATFAMKNIQQFQDRFKILKNESGLVTTTGAVENQRITGYINLSSLPEADRKLQYNAAGAVIPTVNNIFIAFASNETVVGAVLITGGFRLCYVDM